MEEQISSPTFTIVNEYIKNDEKIYHFDVYRLSDLEEFYDMRTEMNIMIDHYVLQNGQI